MSTQRKTFFREPAPKAPKPSINRRLGKFRSELQDDLRQLLTYLGRNQYGRWA